MLANVQLENKRTRVGCSLMKSYLACAITSETKSSFRFQGLHLIRNGCSGGYRFFADLSNGFGNDLLNRLVRIFDEFLIEEAIFFVEFFDTADDHLFDDLFRFAFVQSLLAKDVFFMFQNVSRNFFTFEVCRFCSSDLHGNIFAECFEIVGLSDEVRFAVDFDENTDAAVAMDVRINQTFSSDAVCFLAAAAKPCSRSKSTALSISPLLSVSAFLQSIMPAPVFLSILLPLLL